MSPIVFKRPIQKSSSKFMPSLLTGTQPAQNQSSAFRILTMNKSRSTDNLACSDAEVLLGLGGTATEITVAAVQRAIESAGIVYSRDPRLSTVYTSLSKYPPSKPLPKKVFLDAAASNLTLLHRIATKELAIADFHSFSKHLAHIEALISPIVSGANASYIPILRDAPSDRLGVAFCSVDGQIYTSGDCDDSFSIQSTSKPITFALAMEKLGTEKVLKWCGNEPSGRSFNDITLLPDNRPFNPMVNSGALMTAACLASAHPELLAQDKVGKDGTYAAELCEEILIPLWKRLSGNGIVGDVGFSEETFLSE